MSDTPFTDEAERASRLESGHGFVPEFKQNAVAALARKLEREQVSNNADVRALANHVRKLERQITTIKALQIFAAPIPCHWPDERGPMGIGTVGGGELMIAGERYVKAADLRAALKL